MGTQVMGEARDGLAASKMLLDKVLRLGPHKDDGGDHGDDGARDEKESLNRLFPSSRFLHPHLRSQLLSLAQTPPSPRLDAPLTPDSGLDDSASPSHLRLAFPSSPDPTVWNPSHPPSSTSHALKAQFSGEERQILAPKEEALNLEELEEFAKAFKRKRIKLGFTQGDVGAAIGHVEGSEGSDFSQTTISRFEALNLSFKNMCKLRPLLAAWLSHTEAALASGKLLHPGARGGSEGSGGGSAGRRRKKRTSIESARKSQLEAAFAQNPRPQAEDVSRIAAQLSMEKEVIRVWFCNRRQKEKRTASRSEESTTPPSLLLNFLNAAPRSDSGSPGQANSMDGGEMTGMMAALIQQIAAKRLAALTQE